MSSYASFKLKTNINDKGILESALNGLGIKFKKDGEDFQLSSEGAGFRDVTLKRAGDTYELNGTHDRDFRNIRMGKINVNGTQELSNSIHTAYNVFKTQQDMILKFGFTPVQDSLVVNNGVIQLTVQREGA